jgi:IS605 OrfB family transposase
MPMGRRTASRKRAGRRTVNRERELYPVIQVNVTPDPASKQALIDFMKRYRHALNYSVSAVIAHKALSPDKAYNLLYRELIEKYGLPGLCAVSCYNKAIDIAKGWLKLPHRGDNPPIIKRLVMSLRQQCYTFKDGKVELIGGYKLTATSWDKRYDGYPDIGAKLTYNEWEDKFTLHIVKHMPRPPTYSPKGVLAIDINEREIVVGNASGEKRIETPINKALHYVSLADKLKSKYYNKEYKDSKGYPAWRRRSGILKMINHFRRKASNITEDWARKLSHDIVMEAKRRQLAVAREDLTGLYDRLRELPKSHRRALIWLGYRKLEHWLDWEAKKNGVPVVIVDPSGTSTTCPKCGAKLVEVGYRRRRCPRCGFEADRDTIAVLNIEKKAMSKLWPYGFNKVWTGR